MREFAPSPITDQAYLRGDQYRDASNLNARVQLHARFSTNSYRWPRWVFDQLELPLTSRVLELGCGPGWLWRENMDRIPPHWRITLTDFSTGMLEEACTGLGEITLRFRFEVSDAQAIPFPDESFDAVIANHMLYHVPDRKRAFSEIHRVLMRGGRFYAATNGKAHLRELDKLLTRFGIDTSFRFGKLFSLESGGTQMAPWFPDTAVRRYEDALEVTESEPLMAYVLSGFLKFALTVATLNEMKSAIDREIASRGAFHIAKDAGLLVAEKP